ncbi:MAG: hypothetical protein U0324_31555 [Polyangiales bacterium]
MNRPLRCALALCSAALCPAVASAQARDGAAPRDPLHLLSEPARIVDVVDSFDEGSAFSFRLTAGFLYQRRSATLERELRVSDPTTGMGQAQFARVGDYVENTSTLMVNAELGLFHDLALTFGLPFVVSNTREIRSLTSPGAMEGNNALADGWTQNGTATSLFQVPFRSPDRSGIDQVRLGLAWSILNQQRDRTKPTWTVRFEWRPPVGDVLRACNASPAAGTARSARPPTACPTSPRAPSPPQARPTASVRARRASPAGSTVVLPDGDRAALQLLGLAGARLEFPATFPTPELRKPARAEAPRQSPLGLRRARLRRRRHRTGTTPVGRTAGPRRRFGADRQRRPFPASPRTRARRSTWARHRVRRRALLCTGLRLGVRSLDEHHDVGRGPAARPGPYHGSGSASRSTTGY